MSLPFRENKPWGYEIIWASVPGKYLGKILVIDAGQRLSLQHHEEKDETIYVESGRVEVTFGDSVTFLEPGQAFHVPPGMLHRFKALGSTEARIIEVSTFHPDDVVRHSDDFGRA